MIAPVRPPQIDSKATAKAVQALIERHQSQPGALLPLLHAVQDTLGHVPADAVPLIATGLNLSRAEVHGVITYYHHFRSEPAGRHVVQICRAEACQACGADALIGEAERLLGCGLHKTRPDDAVTLEAVYCLGLCASSPALMVDGTPHARVTAATLARIVAQLEIQA
uniref:NAD-dependent formate dehydrogenase gamma subunit n=1 Tax=mine drainage metagenome TaxID=410659 RepID=E6PKX5_9ZZZZ